LWQLQNQGVKYPKILCFKRFKKKLYPLNIASYYIERIFRGAILSIFRFSFILFFSWCWGQSIFSVDSCPRKMEIKLLVPDHPFSPRYSIMQMDSLFVESFQNSLQFAQIRMGYECSGDGYLPWVKMEWQVDEQAGDSLAPEHCRGIDPTKRNGEGDWMFIPEKEWLIQEQTGVCLQYVVDSLVIGQLLAKMPAKWVAPGDTTLVPANTLPTPTSALTPKSTSKSTIVPDLEASGLQDFSFGEAEWK
jgi:hypothetical protein